MGRTGSLHTAVAAAFALSFFNASALASPFAVRDQNPLLVGFDLPHALPVQLPEPERWMMNASFAWGSSAVVQSNANETIMVDAETRELRLALGRTSSTGLTLQVELPMRQTSAGSLDSFIDNWHDFFDLPEGARATLPRDAYRIGYERDGHWQLDHRKSASGIGDLSLRIGKQLGASPIVGWISLKAPTGDADRLTGSGSWDASVVLALEHAFADRYSVFAQAAGTWMSDGDRIPSWQKNVAWSGMAGISARVFGNLTLIAQLDAHTAVFDSDEDFLNEMVALTVGGTYRLLDTWDLSFAVTEDIAVESTADVVFLFELKTTW